MKEMTREELIDELVKGYRTHLVTFIDSGEDSTLEELDIDVLKDLYYKDSGRFKNCRLEVLTSKGIKPKTKKCKVLGVIPEWLA